MRFVSMKDRRPPNPHQEYLFLRENGDAQVMKAWASSGCSTITHWAEIVLPADHPAARKSAT